MRAAAALLLMLTACTSAPLAVHDQQVARQPHRLAWTGNASVFLPDSKLDLGVSTSLQVLPLDHIRSESWLLSQGPASKRAMIFAGSEAWIERGGKREAMPEAMRRHELQQYGLYELILKAQQLGRGVTKQGASRVALEGAELLFRDGHLAEIRNEVAGSEEGAAKISQTFLLSGEIIDDGISWPRKIEIFQNGKPYFTLELTSFDATKL